MNQILTDEEIARIHRQDGYGAELPLAEFADSARKIESAVLAKIEPLLRRAHAEIRKTREARRREAHEDYNASQANADKEYARRGAILADIRALLGDSV